MIQQLLIAILFSGALFYLGYKMYKTFTAKNSDCGGCGGCSKMDLEKIEKELLSRKRQGGV